MFHDLDSTLEALLNDPAAPAVLRNAAKSFLTPRSTFTPAGATVNLFLHAVEENRELYDPVPGFERQGNTVVRQTPPVRVDCSYLVTTWSNQAGELQVEEEHRLLGLALLWLRRFPTIPDTFLQGGLVGQAYPPPTMAAQVPGRASTGDFWSALGIPPRPAFTLVVTLAMDLLLAAPEGPPVDTLGLRIGISDDTAPAPALIPGTERTYYFIGGTVTNNATGEPVAAANVTLDEIPGLSATTDASGHYHFANIPVGNYTLRASAGGIGTGQRAAQVPDLVLDGYNLSLA
ncbi:MAG: DUF4255 domain-containing protein [Anaerolineae bacterium]|nr:DUF4255 domain-containing protein [Anaerolineae bacterium]